MAQVVSLQRERRLMNVGRTKLMRKMRRCYLGIPLIGTSGRGILTSISWRILRKAGIVDCGVRCWIGRCTNLRGYAVKSTYRMHQYI